MGVRVGDGQGGVFHFPVNADCCGPQGHPPTRGGSCERHVGQAGSTAWGGLGDNSSVSRLHRPGGLPWAEASHCEWGAPPWVREWRSKLQGAQGAPGEAQVSPPPFEAGSVPALACAVGGRCSLLLCWPCGGPAAAHKGRDPRAARAGGQPGPWEGDREQPYMVCGAFVF